MTEIHLDLEETTVDGKGTHLLSSTSDKVESIARQVGFENTAVFSRGFKRWVGRGPKAYRGCGACQRRHDRLADGMTDIRRVERAAAPSRTRARPD